MSNIRIMSHCESKSPWNNISKSSSQKDCPVCSWYAALSISALIRGREPSATHLLIVVAISRTPERLERSNAIPSCLRLGGAGPVADFLLSQPCGQCKSHNICLLDQKSKFGRRAVLLRHSGSEAIRHQHSSSGHQVMHARHATQC